MKRTWLGIWTLVFTTTGISAAAGQDALTIESLLSAPFPTGMVAAPGGDRIAWVQNDRGRRNIWTAAAPAFEGRQVTGYADDDGQELGGLTFTPDGRFLVYVRGGAPNRGGEIPNPTSHGDPAERVIWVVPVDGGEPRRIGEGSAPTISPTGAVIAFLRHGQIWTASVEAAVEPERLVSIRGSAGSLRWSPDGSRLAFVSARGDHSFVGIHHLGSRQVQYLDPSVDRDGSPTWSPQGNRLAFIRTANERRRLPFMPRREAQPWSIRVWDETTESTVEVWRADPGRGSAFRGVAGPNQLWWGGPAGNRIVFPWERTGWTHLYAVPAAGGAAVELTPGEFEVEDVALTPDRRELVLSSNQGDIDRRHLWRVRLNGDPPLPITPGNGLEWAPVPLAAGGVAFMASDARRPAHASVIPGADGRQQALAPESMPPDFPIERLVTPEPVTITAADGMPIPAQLFVPAAVSPGDRRPAMIFFHGGSRRQMLLGWHYLGYYHNTYAFNQFLASRGYVVLSVNYRSGIGYGLDFREALDYGARGASEFNDVLGAGLYLRSRPDVDPDRIGLWGGSYGGYLTALGLARASDLFAAGVDVHGVHDWNVVIENFVPTYDPTSRTEAARLAYQSSPMAFVESWTSPVLLIHGDDDRNVPFRETVDLVEALRHQNVYFEQLVFPDEVHGFLLHANWLAAFHAAADFLDRMLGSEQPPTRPTGEPAGRTMEGAGAVRR